MRVGIGSWTYPWAVGVPGYLPDSPMTALDLVERAVELDVRVVQIADNMPLHLLGEADLEVLARAAAAADVTLEVGICGFAEQYLRQYLHVAAAVGSPLLRVVIDSPQVEPTREEILATLRAVLPDFERAGVDLLIENHDRFTAAQLAQIVRAADSEALGVVYDTVNSLGSLEDAERVLEVLGPWIRNVHIKDVAISRAEHRMGFHVVGAPAGQGDLRLPMLIEEISALGRDMTLLIEQWPVFDGDVETTIRTEAQWAQQSVEHVRGLLTGAPVV